MFLRPKLHVAGSKKEKLATEVDKSGPYIVGGMAEEGWAALPARKTEFCFSNIVFEIAELFLVAILVRNHKKID